MSHECQLISRGQSSEAPVAPRPSTLPGGGQPGGCPQGQRTPCPGPEWPLPGLLHADVACRWARVCSREPISAPGGALGEGEPARGSPAPEVGVLCLLAPPSLKFPFFWRYPCSLVPTKIIIRTQKCQNRTLHPSCLGSKLQKPRGPMASQVIAVAAWARNVVLVHSRPSPLVKESPLFLTVGA